MDPGAHRAGATGGVRPPVEFDGPPAPDIPRPELCMGTQLRYCPDDGDERGVLLSLLCRPEPGISRDIRDCPGLLACPCCCSAWRARLLLRHECGGRTAEPRWGSDGHERLFPVLDLSHL